MIDFNNGKIIPNKFSGSEKKITIEYINDIYMLKFPDPIRQKNRLLSYMNNQYSEYIGCHIFKACGFTTQDTLLGIHKDNKGNNKIVVACKDFTQDGSILYEASKIALTVYDIENKTNLSIEDVYSMIRSCEFINNPNEIIGSFWDMFVVDTLLGNPDRHLTNWGLLYKNGIMQYAPIYDCGSSLGALLSDESMKINLSNPNLFKQTEYNITSCYYLENKRIFYHEIMKAPSEDLQLAIKRIVPKIDIKRIYAIVNSTENLPDIRKEYLIKSIVMRYEQILLPSLKR